MILGGSHDYSLSPEFKQYPAQFLAQWAATNADRNIQFSTLSKYLNAVVPEIHSGNIDIPTTYGGTAYDFDAFWIENPKVKTWYRRDEQTLQAAEMLATIASLRHGYSYPFQQLYDAWVLMCLNMDRNTLWGSAGGMVFVSEKSWDVQDRFQWVEAVTSRVLQEGGQSALTNGEEIAFFNPLNWKRKDPIVAVLPAGKSLQGVRCEALPDGCVLCSPMLPAVGLTGWKLSSKAAAGPQMIRLPASIETSHYTARLNWMTGAISSLKLKPSGRELLAAPANVIVAERPTKLEKSPSDFMAPRPGRTRLGTSSDQPSKAEVSRGPVAVTVQCMAHSTAEANCYGRFAFTIILLA